MNISGRPNTASEIAVALREVADMLATLGDLAMDRPFVALDIQPHGDEPARVAAIDAIATAIAGRPGKTRDMSGGSYHHSVKALVNGITVSAYTSVTSPAERQMREEIERLRAELAHPR